MADVTYLMQELFELTGFQDTMCTDIINAVVVSPGTTVTTELQALANKVSIGGVTVDKAGITFDPTIANARAAFDVWV
jgi:hypothetical protein